MEVNELEKKVNRLVVVNAFNLFCNVATLIVVVFIAAVLV